MRDHNLAGLANAFQLLRMGRRGAQNIGDMAAGVLRREKDGVKLLGKGELKSKIEITVYSASASAKGVAEAMLPVLAVIAEKRA